MAQNEISEHEQQINLMIRRGRKRLEEIEQAMNLKESEKAGIQDDIEILTERLRVISKTNRKKQQAYQQYDKLLRESEEALGKLKESTKALLTVVKKEHTNIDRIIRIQQTQ